MVYFFHSQQVQTNNTTVNMKADQSIKVQNKQRLTETMQLAQRQR